MAMSLVMRRRVKCKRYAIGLFDRLRVDPAILSRSWQMGKCVHGEIERVACLATAMCRAKVRTDRPHRVFVVVVVVEGSGSARVLHQSMVRRV